MNIGHRIEIRLNELNWKRNQLLDRVPELSAATLSSLIRRGSVRSEFDEAIANALGVTVMWLVYGKEPKLLSQQRATEPLSSYRAVPALTPDEQHLLDAYRHAAPEARAAIMAWAVTVLPEKSDDAQGARQAS